MKRRSFCCLSVLSLMGCFTPAVAQISNFPYVQNFDSVAPPALPPGWSSTQNRILGTNDFTTSTTTPHSTPASVGSTNATITQSLISPVFDFSGAVPDSVVFYIRRSATHNARMLVEASLDSGTTFPLRLGDSLTNTLPNSYVQIKLNLPLALATSHAVKFRWRIVADGSGNTGTLRMDDMIISALPPADLSLTGVRFQPLFPIEADSVLAFAKIKNVGQQSAQNFSAEFYVDANNDSIPQPTELRAIVPSTAIVVTQDSIELSANLGTFSASSRLVIAKVMYAPDQNLSNNQRSVSLNIGYRTRSIVVNEIMYAPNGTEPEWVELFNTRTDSINLKSWSVSDNLVTSKHSLTTLNVFIPPAGYILLTRDSAALVDLHPEIRSRVLNVSGFPSLNNTGDGVVLYDGRTLAMDSVAYLPNWGGSTNGNSLERIDPAGPSTSQANWGTSRNPTRSTPGARNSLTRKDRDLAIDSLRIFPAFPVAGDSITINVPVRNIGRDPVPSFVVRLYRDANADSLPQPNELIGTVVRSLPLLPLDSVLVSFAIGVVESHLSIATVSFSGDEDTTNNIMYGTIIIGYSIGSVRVNEIMYAPTGTEPEWIEVVNIRTDSINLKSWSVSDNLVTSKHILTTQNVLIPPAGYVLLTRDSAALVDVHPEIMSRVLNVSGFPSLNNTGDAVVLYDGRTLAMDSVAYLPNWGGSTNGNSLERIDPAGPSTSQANWGTSRNPTRSTPGARNSLTRKDRDLALDSLRIFPAFPVVGDSIRINVPVRNIGRDPVPSFVVRLYRDANADSLPQTNELIGTVVRSLPLLPLDSVLISFAIGSAESHLSIAVAEFSGDEDTTNNIMHGTIIIGYPTGSVRVNEIMYAPTGTEPEWIEVVNTRTDSINLKSWSVSDNVVATKRALTTQNLFVPSNGYVVFTKDSGALIDIHPNIRAKVVNVSGFPSLNNTGDAVVLYDQRVATMDSVSYLPGWGGSNGNSLERIDLFASSTQQTNWGTSHDSSRSTPGRRNSIARKDYDLAVDSMKYEGPQFPVVGDEVRFMVTIKNPGREPITAYAVHWYHDANADSIPQPGEHRSTSNFTALNPLDSLVIPFHEILQAGTQQFIARVEFIADEDTTNNSRVGGTVVGLMPGRVCINEIMYAPGSGTPEWVELYNMLSDTVDLQKWLLGNRSATPRYEIAGSRLTLSPNDFIVLTKDTALFRQTYSSSVIRVVQVASLPTFLWNNSGDAVVLADSRKLLMDSVFYHATWGGTSGKSLERIDPSGVPNDSTNWGSSTDSLGATPGRRNSQLFLENDLRVMRVLPDTISPGENATITVVVQNAGMLSISNFDLVLFDDVDGDSVSSSAEQFFTRSISQTLASRDSLIVSAAWVRPSSGIHRVIVQVNYGPDQRLSNNKGYSTIRVGFPERALVINEIMFAPMTNNAEYVEFYNASQIDMDLAQWKIHDRISSGSANEYKLVSKSKLLRPGETFTLASDSTVFRMVSSSREERLFSILNQSSLSLNNEGDDIVLIDPAGLVVDSVRYSPSWHNSNITDKTGRSLEKINPLLTSNLARNWTTSAHPSGGTPGRQNSVYAAQLPVHSKLSIAPNPFSPDGDGREDFTIIQYEMPLAVSTIRARIYDSVGRNIRSLANNEASGARGSIVWDGLDDDRRKARIGIYILLLEAIDDRGGVVETVKGVVVLAAKL